MNVRQQLYKKYRLEGYSKYTSARKAGYAHNTAVAAKQNIENRLNMDFWLEKAGLTDVALSDHIDKGLNAMKVISANITYGEADGKTTDFIDVPDWPSRHKYMETILKLRNKVTDKPLIDQSKHQHFMFQYTKINEDRIRSTQRSDGSLGVGSTVAGSGSRPQIR